MVKVFKDEKQSDIYYFVETEQEKNKRKLKEEIKKKNKDKNFNELTRVEKDELLLTLLKLHDLI